MESVQARGNDTVTQAPVSMAAKLQSSLNSKGKPLQFSSPLFREGKVVVKVDVNEVNSLNKIWNNSIVLNVVGQTSTIDSVYRYVGAAWNNVSRLKVFFHSEGYLWSNSNPRRM